MKSLEQLLPLAKQRVIAFEKCFGEKPTPEFVKEVCEELLKQRQKEWLINNLPSQDFHPQDIRNFPEAAKLVMGHRKPGRPPKDRSNDNPKPINSGAMTL
jgi:hypothetical protein